MKMNFALILFFLCTASVWAKSYTINDSFYDEEANYSEFSGRISDRDVTSHIFKIESENDNVKFFRAGDKIQFTVGKVKGDLCEGYVRDVERTHFVIYVKNIGSCWTKDEDYLRRGSRLHFSSRDLERRIHEASLYRVVLLKRKDDFLKQLSDINNFLWAYKEKQVQLASDYDKQILELQKRKRDALDHMLLKKKDSVHLQLELIKKLDELDQDLVDYRIEKVELHADRWATDHDTGLPVLNRPQKLIQKD